MQNLSKRISEVSCLYRSTIRRKGLLVPQNPHLFQLYALKVSCLLMGVAFNIHTGMYLSFQVENAKILSASKYDADSRTVWSWYVATTADCLWHYKKSKIDVLYWQCMIDIERTVNFRFYWFSTPEYLDLRLVESFLQYSEIFGRHFKV